MRIDEGIIFGVPPLARVFICVAAYVGVDLLTKPQAYKDEQPRFEDVISKWPSILKGRAEPLA